MVFPPPQSLVGANRAAADQADDAIDRKFGFEVASSGSYLGFLVNMQSVRFLRGREGGPAGPLRVWA